MKNFFLLAIISSAVFSTSAFSYGGGGPDFKDVFFIVADHNNNGHIDIKEAKKVYNLSNQDVFAKYDKSGEGFISKVEFEEYLRLRTLEE